MRTMRRRGATPSAAQSIVEFALVIPLFLLLVLALIDFGRMLFTYVSVANGSRELARSMTINTNPASTVIAAFNNSTIFGGAISPATLVTLQPAAGTGSGSISCTGTTSPLCIIKVTSVAGSVTLTNQSGASGSATYTGTSPTYRFNPTSTGDFVMLTWLAPDAQGLLQGFIEPCQLPLTAACTFPFPLPTTPPSTRASYTDGLLQVDVAHNFRFNPLFQNQLAGVIDVSFMRPLTLVTTSVRIYGE
jgi:Flp pilus assembly protein TadG